MAVKAIRAASGYDVRPTRVRFAHIRPRDAQEFERFFGCSVEFGAPSDQLEFSNETLALPLITADPAKSGDEEHRRQQRCVHGCEAQKIGRAQLACIMQRRDVSASVGGAFW